ncbi:MAG: SDR family NAD(P)-dependent oxidoreductase [Phycisphaerae bacterium]|nr:SDR family NAD(P)-dependent oxidoreductase [Phycisphaerae bacterium]
MHVLITGGAGFIGSHLADELLRRGHRVRLLDNLCEQVHGGRAPDYLPRAAEFVRGDIRDRSAVVAAIAGVEAVAHLACAVGVAQSQYEIEHYVDVNIRGTAVLADVLANERHDVRRVLLPGSMTAYGEGAARCAACGVVRPNIRTAEDVAGGRWEPRCPTCGREAASIPTGESAELRSQSIYALTKRTQEELLAHVDRLCGVPFVCTRLFNVYGPRQSLSNPYTGVTAIFISRVKSGAAPVVFEDGRQTRDFIWVGDVAATLSELLESGRGDHGTFNIASGRATPIREIAERIARLMGVPIVPAASGTFRFGDVRHCTADISKSRDAFGFLPRTSLDEGLAHLVRWSLSQDSRDGFDRTLDELSRRRMLTRTV